MLHCTPLSLAAFLALPAMAQAPAATPPKASQPIDLAICLDISGSMDGLIDAARTRIWDIVNDLALAKPTPQLRVALLTFGCQAYDPATGWVKTDLPFTDDLDAISKHLFALTTNGGDEYVGRVVNAATGLEWSTDPNALKLIVVAGNESADQDQTIRYGDASRAAIAKGIMVDSIYCGSPADELAPAWREVATLADGRFAAIEKDTDLNISSPYDDMLARLSTDLNGTYFAYGARAAEGAAAQWAQDANAVSAGTAVLAQRCVTKGSALYSNSAWDVCDAVREGTVKLEDMKDEDLPEELRGKTIEEKRALIAAAQKRRDEIQAEIQLVGQKRQAFVEEELKKRAGEAEARFDVALRKAIRAQAESKGFAFPQAPPAGGNGASPASSN